MQGSRFQPMQLAGVGRWLPDRVIKNDELEERMGLRSGWIEKATGVQERRWVEDGTSAIDMGVRAATEALAMAEMDARDIDLIINASGTPHRVIPDNAPIFQSALGLGDSGIAALSVHATCLSFLAAVDLAAALMAAHRYRNVLVISSEIASRALDFDDPETTSLFGDGAAAAVFRRPEGESRSGVLLSRFSTYGDAYDQSTIRLGSSDYPYVPGADASATHFRMDGRRIYRTAHRHAPAFFESLGPEWPALSQELTAVIPHQTTRRGIEGLARYGLARERTVVTLHKYGNCVAASIPITLYEAVATGRVSEGDLFLLFGTGAGLSFGACLVRY